MHPRTRVAGWLPLLLLFLSLPAAAQADRLLVTGYATQTVGLLEIDANATVVATFAPLPTLDVPSVIVPAEDNRAYYAPSFLAGVFTGVIYGIDARGTVWTAHHSSPLERPLQMIHTDDGDWLVFDWEFYSPWYVRLLRWDGAASFSTISRYPILTRGAAIHAETGSVAVRAGIQAGPYAYLLIDPSTGAVTTFTSPPGFNGGYGAHELIYDSASAGFRDVLFDAAGKRANLVQVDASGITTLASLGAWCALDTVPADQTSNLAYYALTCSLQNCTINGLACVTRNGTVVSHRLISGGQVSYQPTLVRRESRHLTWRMDRRPNGRSLRLSFPQRPNAPFVAAFSLQGTRPGIRLSDGRVIGLVPDALFALCLAGGVPGVLGPTVGRLDAAGTAQVRVDLNGFGGRLKGVVIWGAVAVLDPPAPSGVAYVAGPTHLKIKQ